MRDRFDDYLFNQVKLSVASINDRDVTLVGIVEKMNSIDGLYDHYLNLNTGRKKSNKFIPIVIKRAILARNYSSVQEFVASIKSTKSVVNHKVKSVEFLSEKDDVYCMEVENYHNFALDTFGGTDRNGFFVKNTMLDDFFLPVRGSDNGTKIDTLPGMEFTGIDDLEYLRNKMMAALKIPKAFLNYDENTSGKATLASEDLRFARTIIRLQNIVLSELNKIAVIHLYSQGYRNEELVNFKLELTNPSTIFEKEKVALWADKVDLAMNMLESKLFSYKWIYRNIFNLTDDDIEDVQVDVVEDQKQAWRFKSIEEEGNDPAKPFQKINPQGGAVGGGEEGPGELPGMGGGGEPMGGGEELPIPPGGPEPMDEEVSPLNEPSASLSETESRERRIRNRNRPSQEGEKQQWMKKFDNVTFGEDPLGDKEINSEPRKGREIRHIFRGNSPLAIESVMKSGLIKNLEAFLNSEGNEKKELLTEVGNQKSMLDEDNIIDTTEQ
jgi:hypothetical protein